MKNKLDDKKEYVNVEGIMCEVKNPSKKDSVLYCQDNLRQAISDYERSVDRWIESKKAYRDALLINVIITPFVLGWLKRPEDPDEYLVITGFMTMDELKAKRKKEAKKKPQKAPTPNPNIKSALKAPKTVKKQDSKKAAPGTASDTSEK